MSKSAATQSRHARSAKPRALTSSPAPTAGASRKPAKQKARKAGGGAGGGSTTRKDFERARDVQPTGITGKERPTDIIARMFPAYVGRQERTAFELMQRSSADDTTTFLTFSGRDDAGGAPPVVPHPAHRARPGGLHHDHGREPLSRRAPHHRPPHPRDRPQRGRPRLPPGARDPHLRPRLLGGDAPRDRQALLGHPAEAGVPEEDACGSPSSSRISMLGR